MNSEKISEAEITQRIEGLYPDATIDIAGEDCSFEVYVLSEQFEGMNTLQRQKSILGLFKDEITSGKLHALSVKTKTPKEQAANSGLVQIQI
jgi:BolA protein